MNKIVVAIIVIAVLALGWFMMKGSSDSNSVNVRTGSGGASVEMDGVDVDTGAGGVNVNMPGIDVETR